MDSDLQDISCSHDVLKNMIHQNGQGNENLAVKEYLKKVKYPPIKDFSEGIIKYSLLYCFVDSF